ncbi:MAG: hypothetical protein J5981_05285 [Lachnospira sp.]|nr:hypothetical protein [Lachnospira sp.]
MGFVENFYYELKKNNSRMTGQIAGSVAIEIIFGYVPMIYPIGFVFRGDMDAAWFAAVSIFMLAIAMYLYMRSYSVIQENGEVHSVMEKLRYIPVAVSEVRSYLQQRLNNFCIRVFVVCALIQVIGNAIAKTGVLYGLLYACLLSGLLWVIGSVDLRRVKI